MYYLLPKLSHFSLWLAAMLYLVDSQCPLVCICSINLTKLDCIGRGLQAIPQQLPTSALDINLQFNSIGASFQSNPNFVSPFLKTPKLMSLDLSRNGITTIPQSLFIQLWNLSVLKLDRNAISVLRLEVFTPLRSLTVLHLDLNSIITISLAVTPPSSELLSLQQLYLNNNNIVNITSVTFAIFSSISEMYLQYNQISFIAPNVFSRLSPTYLNIGANALTSDNFTFGNISTLTQLSAYSNNLGVLTENVFRGLPALQYLSLSDNPNLKFLRGALQNNRNISELYVQGCDTNITQFYQENLFALFKLMSFGVTSAALGVFPYWLCQQIPSLRNVYMQNSGITSISTEMSHKCSQLQMIDLQFNNISRIETGAFINVTYQSLYLSNNQIEHLAPDMLYSPVQLRNSSPVIYVQFNMINCDCAFSAILNILTKVSIIGTCASPETLVGRNISSLRFTDFHCLQSTEPINLTTEQARLKLSTVTSSSPLTSSNRSSGVSWLSSGPRKESTQGSVDWTTPVIMFSSRPATTAPRLSSTATDKATTYVLPTVTTRSEKTAGVQTAGRTAEINHTYSLSPGENTTGATRVTASIMKSISPAVATTIASTRSAAVEQATLEVLRSSPAALSKTEQDITISATEKQVKPTETSQSSNGQPTETIQTTETTPVTQKETTSSTATSITSQATTAVEESTTASTTTIGETEVMSIVVKTVPQTVTTTVTTTVSTTATGPTITVPQTTTTTTQGKTTATATIATGTAAMAVPWVVTSLGNITTPISPSSTSAYTTQNHPSNNDSSTVAMTRIYTEVTVAPSPLVTSPSGFVNSTEMSIRSPDVTSWQTLLSTKIQTAAESSENNNGDRGNTVIIAAVIGSLGGVALVVLVIALALCRNRRYKGSTAQKTREELNSIKDEQDIHNITADVLVYPTGIEGNNGLQGTELETKEDSKDDGEEVIYIMVEPPSLIVPPISKSNNGHLLEAYKPVEYIDVGDTRECTRNDGENNVSYV